MSPTVATETKMLRSLTSVPPVLFPLYGVEKVQGQERPRQSPVGEPKPAITADSTIAAHSAGATGARLPQPASPRGGTPRAVLAVGSPGIGCGDTRGTTPRPAPSTPRTTPCERLPGSPDGRGETSTRRVPLAIRIARPRPAPRPPPDRTCRR